MTLTEFLLARIAEDEGEAERWRQAMDADEEIGRGVPAWVVMAGGIKVPDRVLAECEAKRRIVELSWHHFGEDDYAWGMEEAKRQVLAILALPYADHPDYRSEWAP